LCRNLGPVSGKGLPVLGMGHLKGELGGRPAMIILESLFQTCFQSGFLYVPVCGDIPALGRTGDQG